MKRRKATVTALGINIESAERWHRRRRKTQQCAPTNDYYHHTKSWITCTSVDCAMAQGELEGIEQAALSYGEFIRRIRSIFGAQ